MSNLLEKASILLTPTAYDDGKILSVKPEDGTGDFDFTRNSSATRVNSQGLIEDVQILSSNLVSNGDFSQEGAEQVTNGDFSNGETNWEFGGDWTLVSGTAEILTSTNSFLIQSNVVDLSVKTYKIQYEVVSTNGSNFRLAGGNSAFGNVTLDSATIGVKTLYLTSNGTKRNLQFNQNAFRGSIDNVSVKEVGQDWTLGTGWSIGDNVANAVDAAFNSQLVYSDNVVANTKYKVSFNVSNYVKGNVRVNIGNVGSDTVSSNGNFTFVLTSANVAPLIIQSWAGGSGTSLSVTNISVVEITDDTNLPRINYEGFSYQDALGSELVTNGGFDNGGSNWVNLNNLAVFENSSVVFENNAKIYQAVVSDLSGLYNLEIEFSSISGNGIQILLGNGNSFVYYSVSDIINNGNKITITKTSFIGSGILFIYSQNINTSAVIDNVSVKEYLGQEPIPDSGCGSWLFEPQSTNEISYSEDFSNAYWSKLGSPTVTLNYGVSPSGQNNSVRIQGNSSTVIYNAGSFSATDGRSMYVKATSGSGNIQLLSHTSNTDNVFSIDENWKRVEINTAAGVGSIFYAVDMRGASTDIFDIEIWGAQIEQNSYATSYIPTNGSTVTRLQDAAFGAGSSDLINSTEGVLYAEIAALGTGNYKLISLNNGSPGNSVTIGFHQGTINFYFRVASSNGTTTYNTFPIDYDGFNKIALKYKSGDISIFANGTKKVQSSGTFAFASSLNKLNFDYGNGGLPFFGKTKCLAVFKEALTDEELECLTT